MKNRNKFTLTMSKKSLNVIITALGVALDTDCRIMSELSNDKLDRLLSIYEDLVDGRNQVDADYGKGKVPKKGTAEYDAMIEDVLANA